jgi:PAS domain-containing protein
LAALVQDSPAGLASLAGPTHVVTVTNQLFRRLFSDRTLLGLPLTEALPELADQPFFARLAEVYRTGTTCYGAEALAFRDATQASPRGALYFTFIAQAVRDAAGAVSGLLLFAYNVSAHVRARHSSARGTRQGSTSQQLATVNQQLTVANEELDVSNEELLVSNEELRVANERLAVANHQLQVYNEEMQRQAEDLRQADQVVRRLNNDLALTNAGLVETIVDNLQATEFACAEAEGERRRLHQLVAEAPAMIAVLTGPDYIVELANDHFHALFGHRKLVGQPFRQAVPELVNQPFLEQLEEVYRTGESYTGTNVPVIQAGTPSSELEPLFTTYIFQATRDETGQVTGILIFAYDVTRQVRAWQAVEASRQQVEAPNPQPAAHNADLGTTTEEPPTK